ncbi:YY1-associated factor 2-like isoform X3 [Portunus trituberculatus]|uniref:YY1-associated factor 2-like isoform X3 n=1 Tax=Portunus trituberculatus TaxID=210409 RepID=UPI001E1CC759|nr:YY1-associated factor 2-like isoform X3 [Portunus trituberculatus]
MQLNVHEIKIKLYTCFRASLNGLGPKRVKRTNKEENMWDCSVCTYRNSPEAFKCLMCDVRKGTSTRKPRLNAELVAAQVAQVVPPKIKKAEKKDRDRKGDGRNLQKGRPRLKNVDRSTAQHNAVTVNNVTVIITEFQPKHRSSSTTSSSKTTATSGNTSSATNGDAQVMSSSEAGSISDASTDTTRNGDMTTESRSS